jgi:hypothetical protein
MGSPSREVRICRISRDGRAFSPPTPETLRAAGFFTPAKLPAKQVFQVWSVAGLPFLTARPATTGFEALNAFSERGPRSPRHRTPVAGYPQLPVSCRGACRGMRSAIAKEEFPA